MSKISVLVADDHDIVRDGLRELVNNQPDMEIVADARDGEEALEKVRACRPDVILIDIVMPGLNGLAVAELTKEISPRTKIVIFSMHKKDAYVQQALSAGARGYVFESSPSSEILDAIRAVERGNYFLSSHLQAEVIENYIKQQGKKPESTGYDALSEREQEVFRLIVEGKSTKDMADIFSLSPKTIEKYRSNVMKKLGIHSPLELMKYAVKIGIIDPELWDE